MPEFLILMGIMTIGAFIRCYRLGEISFWFDESFSWKMTTFPWSEVWGRVALDNHPPLFFYLLKVWVLIVGESAIAMRSLSVLFGTIGIVGAYLVVREINLTNPSHPSSSDSIHISALFAAGLFALAPFQIEWSQQVRMYALGSCLTLWSSWFLLRAVRCPTAKSVDWWGYILTASALVYTHYYGLFILGAQFLYAVCLGLSRLFRPRPDDDGHARLLSLALACSLINLVFLPWLPRFLDHRQQVANSFWSGALKWRTILVASEHMWTGEWTEWGYDPKVCALFAGLSLTIFIFLLAFGRGGQRFLALGPLTTFAAASAVSLTSRSILTTRYVLFAHSLAICGLALVIQRLPGTWLRAGAGAMVLLGLSWLCLQGADRRDRWASRPGFESAVAYVDEMRAPDEPVLVSNPMLQINGSAYLADRTTIFVLSEDRRFHHYHGTAVMRDSEYLTPEQVSALRGSRVWVIEGRKWNGGTNTVTLPEPWVDIREESFLDWYGPKCEIVVKECVRRRSSHSNGPRVNSNVDATEMN